MFCSVVFGQDGPKDHLDFDKGETVTVERPDRPTREFRDSAGADRRGDPKGDPREIRGPGSGEQERSGTVNVRCTTGCSDEEVITAAIEAYLKKNGTRLIVKNIVKIAVRVLEISTIGNPIVWSVDFTLRLLNPTSTAPPASDEYRPAGPPPPPREGPRPLSRADNY